MSVLRTIRGTVTISIEQINVSFVANECPHDEGTYHVDARDIDGESTCRFHIRPYFMMNETQIAQNIIDAIPQAIVAEISRNAHFDITWIDTEVEIAREST